MGDEGGGYGIKTILNAVAWALAALEPGSCPGLLASSEGTF